MIIGRAARQLALLSAVFWGSAALAAENYQGCFNGPLQGDLDAHRWQAPEVTMSACVNRCAATGARYAGVQNADTCVCGDTFGAGGRAPDSACNQSCAGGGALCGGSGTYRVVGVPAAARTQSGTAATQAAPTPQPAAGNNTLLGTLLQGAVSIYTEQQQQELAEAERELERERLQLQQQQQRAVTTAGTSSAASVTANTTAASGGGAGVSTVSGFADGVNGWNVSLVAFPGGQIAQSDQGWQLSKSGASSTPLAEQYRADWSVFLFDEKAGARYELNLKEKQIFFQDPQTARTALHPIQGARKQ